MFVLRLKLDENQVLRFIFIQLSSRLIYSFDIGLYMSQQLYNNEGNTPINRAEEHIGDAINDATGFGC